MKKYPVKIQISFCRSMNTLLEGGLSLTRALEVSGGHKDIIERLLSGEELSECLKARFSEIIVSLVSIGEKTGKIAEMLILAADHMEQQEKFKKKLVKALSYPVLVLFVSLCSILFFSVFVLPQLKMVFDQLGTKPPVAIQIIGSFPLLIGGLVLSGIIFAVCIKKLSKNEKFAEKLSIHKYKLPLMGSLFMKLHASATARILSILLGSGMPLLDAIERTRLSAKGKAMKDCLYRVGEACRSGQMISTAFFSESIIDKKLGLLTRIGEETGQIDKMLASASKALEEEAENCISSIAMLVEPAATLLVGVFVGFVVISMMSPMISVVSSLK